MNRIIEIIVLLLVFLCFIYNALAQEKVVENLILNKTKTKLGYDFYELFSIFWQESTEVRGDNVILEEITDPQFGSKINVIVQDFVIYQSIITPRFEDLQERAKEAVEITREFMFNWQKYQKYLEEEQRIR